MSKRRSDVQLKADLEMVTDHEGKAAEKSKLQRDGGTMVAQAAEKSMVCKAN